ncbi:LysR substrate binding domain protein [compost metagenome]
MDAWEFERQGKKLKVRVDGRLVFNTTTHVADAAVGVMSIAYLPEEEFSPHIAEGRLIPGLDDWCTPFSGYHLYYPSRRQPSLAFSLVVGDSPSGLRPG